MYNLYRVAVLSWQENLTLHKQLRLLSSTRQTVIAPRIPAAKIAVKLPNNEMDEAGVLDLLNVT